VAKILVSLNLLASPAFGITIGELQTAGFTSFTTNPQTMINTSRLAVEAGTVQSVTLTWSGAPAAGCNNALKVKFLSRMLGNEIRVTADRGPFDVQNGTNTYPIPTVDVAIGDWIGVTKLTDGCGGMRQAFNDTGVTAQSFSDPPTMAGYGRWFAAFSCLLLAVHEIHELVHAVTGRILCDEWPTRDFNAWRLGG